MIWRPHETGACLIIDDPLLKTRYGFCDFLRWRDRMREHRFTTCIAFIPWNWPGNDATRQRILQVGIRLVFSVDTWLRPHRRRIRLVVGGSDRPPRSPGANPHAQASGAHRDSTRPCDGVPPRCLFVGLSRDLEGERVCGGRQHRDFARRRRPTHNPHSGRVGPGHSEYCSFAIYTRRYPYHGLENFAFDLLLGKPCFIVAHHESLRHGGASLLTLIDRLQALNCTLQWQSPGHIVRRAYRRRRVDGLEQVEMYANEIRIINAEDRDLRVHIRKRETVPGAVIQCLANGVSVPWTRETDSVVCEGEIRPGTEWLFKVVYSTGAARHRDGDPLRYKLSVAARRMLSEVRDELQPRLRFGYA